ARVDPRVLVPRLIAELTGLGDGVEDPQAFACANVKATDITFDVRLTGGHTTRSMRRADDDDILRHDRRRVQTDLTRERIDRLIVVLLQIDDAVHAEARNA